MKIRKAVKRSFLLIVFLALAGLLGSRLLRPSYVAIPVSFSKNLFPIVEADIGGNPYSLEFYQTSKYPLWISGECLNGVQKRETGEASWKDGTGAEHQGPLFEVPSVKLGGLARNNVSMASNKPIVPEAAGSISWSFDQMNLLLDFPHYKIWGIRNERALKQLGIDLSKMERSKCKITRKGIFFDADTSLGPLTCSLRTMVNRNVIAEHLSGSSENCILATRIGDRSFGEPQFFPRPITSELELDAILGSIFLLNHIVYIDARHEYLYIGEKFRNTLSTNPTTKIPLEFTLNGLPVMQLEINKKKYPVMFDTGSVQELNIPSGQFTLDALEYLGASEITNIFGNATTVNHYLLPECKIEGIILKNLLIEQDDNLPCALPDFSCEQQGSFEEEWGTFGRALLDRTNLYCHFPESCMWMVNHLKDLRNLGIDLESHTAIPFEANNEGITLKVQTELGILNLLLDTGATITLVKNSLIKLEDLAVDELENSHFLTHHFALGHYDYGQQPLYPLQFGSRLERFDGILGMDFLRKHPFYIDYQNRILYVAKPNYASEGCGQTTGRSPQG